MNKAENEKIKRKYFAWLKEAEGFSYTTIESIEKAIWKYEEFTKNSNYKDFNDEVAKKFKKYLATNRNIISKKILSLKSQYDVLRHLNNFFTWLAGQPGYKSKITIYDVQYLRLSKKDSRKATAIKPQKYPSTDYIKKLCKSIKIKNEIDLRDRALIAFTLLSGMRDQAIISLSIGCFDPDTLEVFQDPNKGVRTKFSKQIVTTLFKFDSKLRKYVIDWYKLLVTEKNYSNQHPLFPRTKLKQKSKSNYCFIADEIEPKFWKDVSTVQKIFKKRCEEAKLEYYSPHKYRHTAISEAKKYVSSIEELKAISQNVGHENISTTFYNYGTIPDNRVSEIISDIDFDSSKKNDQLSNEKLQRIKRIIEG